MKAILELDLCIKRGSATFSAGVCTLSLGADCAGKALIITRLGMNDGHWCHCYDMSGGNYMVQSLSIVNGEAIPDADDDADFNWVAL